MLDTRVKSKQNKLSPSPRGAEVLGRGTGKQPGREVNKQEIATFHEGWGGDWKVVLKEEWSGEKASLWGFEL